MKRRVGLSIVYTLWVVIGFVAAQFIIGLVLVLSKELGFSINFANDTVMNTILAAVSYILALAIIAGLPWWLKRKATTVKDLGLQRLPEWKDLLLAGVGMIVYLFGSAFLVQLAGSIDGFDPKQAQDIGFTHLTKSFEYVLAFVTLVILAPLAEETLFRGYLFAKVRARLPFVWTMLLVSLVFALLHVPGMSETGQWQWQWNVAVDVLALSLVLTGLREYTGSIWAGVVLHMFKNGLAFYLLFVNPELLRTIGT